MRIGFVAPNYFPTFRGGGEISLKLLAEELVKRGHQVLVLSFDSKTGAGQKEEINGVTVIRYKRFFENAPFLTLTLPVWLIMKRWEEYVDVYHLYLMSAMPGGGLYKILGGKQNVLATLNSYAAICPTGVHTCRKGKCTFAERFHCLHVLDEQPFVSSILYSIVYPVLTYLSKKLDRYIALSNTEKAEYVLGGFKETRICVIPNFKEPFEKGFVEPYSTRSSTSPVFTILYVGSMIQEKGVGVLIKAFAKVSIRHNAAQLVLVGSGKDLEHYQTMVKKLGLGNRVVFKGKVTGRQEIRNIYLSATMFVHPGLWSEPFGRTLLEAMTFDLPTIVSNVGAPPETVGSSGLVFESGNAAKLAEKIEMLIEKPELRNELSSRCSEALKRFEPEIVVKRIEALYSTLINRGQRSSHA